MRSSTTTTFVARYMILNCYGKESRCAKMDSYADWCSLSLFLHYRIILAENMFA